MMRANSLSFGAILLSLGGAVLLGGCGAKEERSSQEQQIGDRLEQIVKQSGGNWDRLSSQDRDYLVHTVSQGSEPSAKMLLKARAGLLKATPHGAGKPR